MFYVRNYNNERLYTTIWCMTLLIMTIDPTFSQHKFESRTVFSPQGTQFVPVNEPAQLLSVTITKSLKRCVIQCNENAWCRVFDYNVSVPQQCRLFEGDANTLGSIVPSSSQSKVGTIQFSASLFVQYGLPSVSYCQESRYLMCNNNSTCQCMPHTYWNESIAMCVPQLPVLGASCQRNLTMCREDLNYTCLSSGYCGTEFCAPRNCEGM